MAVATYSYDSPPAAERAALPSDLDFVAALASPVEVGGRQLNVTELPTSREPSGE